MEDDAHRNFERLVAHIDYPMHIVTTVGPDGERAGCLVGFATQISIHPARYLIGLSNKNHTYKVARNASHLGVHLPARDQHELAELFGGQSSDTVDKFAQCAWSEGPEGVPLLDDCEAWFVGRILDRVALGDHIGHIVEPIAAHAANVEHLRFGDAKDIEPGHEP